MPDPGNDVVPDLLQSIPDLMHLAVIRLVGDLPQQDECTGAVFDQVIAVLVGEVKVVALQDKEGIIHIGAVDTSQHLIHLEAEEMFLMFGVANLEMLAGKRFEIGDKVGKVHIMSLKFQV